MSRTSAGRATSRLSTATLTALVGYAPALGETDTVAGCDQALAEINARRHEFNNAMGRRPYTEQHALIVEMGRLGALRGEIRAKRHHLVTADLPGDWYTRAFVAAAYERLDAATYRAIADAAERARVGGMRGRRG